MAKNLKRFILQAEFEAKETEIQKKIDELRDTKTKLEQNEKIKRDMMVSKDIIIVRFDHRS